LLEIKPYEAVRPSALKLFWFHDGRGSFGLDAAARRRYVLAALGHDGFTTNHLDRRTVETKRADHANTVH